MSYTLDQSADAYQEMRPRVSARLVAASTMLELSGLALQEAISRELEENPALEADEISTCEVCGTPLQGSICPTCLRLQRHDLPADGLDGYGPDAELESIAARGPDDEEFDPLSTAAGRETLQERLIADLGTILPREDKPIATHLVGNLDERGYLACSAEEIADMLAVEAARVEAVLAALQTLEPVGVGARDLRECLLIQIDHLALRGIHHPLVRSIIEEHLNILASRKLERIARLMRVPVEEVETAARFIREHLNPFPAQGHAGSEAIAEARATYTWPDVVIVQVEDQFVVEVIEARRLELRVASAYHQLARQGADISDAEREHVKQFVTRAKLFVQNVAQRRQTIKKITEAIVKAQIEFLRHGIRHLKPLTRSQIAIAAGVDESTVSRATNGKNVLLPSGQVVSFDTFFTPALSIHDVIKEILANESRPMTDGEIAKELAGRGIHVARRTVAKYRAQIGVLPSILRPDPSRTPANAA
ncbi:MAG TPA: RNA polymerase factor sigma-54 [Chloroflexota bacterium]|nr:RNA polymerase factor sigma-54 [Chloroflexota bacterium]